MSLRHNNHFPFFDLWLQYEKDHQAKYSSQTIISKKRNIRMFCNYISSQKTSFANITPNVIQGYIEEKRNLKPRSLYTHLSDIILFLRYLEKNKKCKPRLSNSILRPSIWKDSGIPSALPWNIIQQLHKMPADREFSPRRNNAIILLLSTYGVRAGEICRLKCSDIDWESETIKFERTKTYISSKYPLDIEVGNSIVEYISHERYNGESEYLFLQNKSAVKPLTPHCVWVVLNSRLKKIEKNYNGRHGPHSIRHAVAQHLLEKGCTYKEIGDFLGHKHLISTTVYAKIDYERLKKSALVNIADLLNSDCSITSFYQNNLLSSTKNSSIENIGDLL